MDYGMKNVVVDIVSMIGKKSWMLALIDLGWTMMTRPMGEFINDFDAFLQVLEGVDIEDRVWISQR